MRTPDEALARVRRRVEERWAAAVWGEDAAAAPSPSALAPNVDTRSTDDEPDTASWPHVVPLGRPSSAELGARFSTFIGQVHDWRAWATQRHVELQEETRAVAGTRHSIPVRVVVPDLDTAARLIDWTNLITQARLRAALIRDLHANASDPVRALRLAAGLSDVDFDIASRAATWFAARARFGGPEPEQLTPRQVPIEGAHAKWLNHHQALVRNLAGIDDLHLAPAHPARIHFTYLDPDHLTRGRRHDSYSVGDTFELPYTPRVVVISENKDTAVGFPPVRGGVAVEGAGNGGGTIAATSWIRDAPLVIYWGDLDIDGLRILNEFRASGVPAVSILMDRATYDTYARYGTNADKNGKPITTRPGPEPTHLTEGERALYDHLHSPHAAVLRVEQERIPLPVALEQVEAWCADLLSSSGRNT